MDGMRPPLRHPERIQLHTRRGGEWTPGKGAFIAAAVAVICIIIAMGI